jgi:hypothetical protein
MYSPTVWREHSMTTAQKLTALDNLEGMYAEAVSYIDGITHSSLYYTDAQASAKFFTSATDGSGSGLIAATLDGMGADQIIAAGTPSGNIAWWSICNGLNGTPDLRNRFIVGAGSHYAKDAAGGANTVTTTGTVTVAGHALTGGEIAKHDHGTFPDYYASGSGRDYASPGIGSPTTSSMGPSNSSHDTSTGSVGSGDAHSHTASFAGSANQEKRPTFYAICYIMKS